MKSLHTHLNTETSSLRLTSSEQRRMRRAVYAAIAGNRGVVPSPYIFWFARHPRVSVFSSAALFAVLLMGGTVYAAQGSLPGDPLYGVKINVTEPLQVALAPTPQAKALVHAEFAHERIIEAETLATRGRLTADTSEELQANFNAQARDALALAQKAAASLPVVEITSEDSATSRTHPASPPPGGTLATTSLHLTIATTSSFVTELKKSLDAQAATLNDLKLLKEKSAERGASEKNSGSTSTRSSSYESHLQQYSQHNGSFVFPVNMNVASIINATAIVPLPKSTTGTTTVPLHVGREGLATTTKKGIQNHPFLFLYAPYRASSTVKLKLPSLH